MDTLIIDRSDPTPIHAQIARHLRQQIVAGQLAKGKRLPPVTYMVRQYGTSVGTIQRVLRDLQAEGLVNARRGSGTFVAEHGGDPLSPSKTLWVDSLKRSIQPQDVTRIQNDFHRVAMGGKVAVRKENPDVIYLEADFVPLHAAELLDVGDVIEQVYGRSRNDECLFKPLQIDGRSLFMPMSINPGAIFCNVAAFEAAGIPLPPPDWTWNDCIRIARELTRPQEGRYGFHPNAFSSLHMCGLWQNGGRTFTEDGEHVCVDDGLSLSFCETLRELSHYCPPDAALRGDQMKVLDHFVAGGVAMFLGSIWHPNDLRLRAWTKWTCVPLPRGDKAVGLKHAEGFGIRAASPIPQMAREFLKIVGQLEKWPDRQGSIQGLYLHADLQQHTQVEETFRTMAALGRTPLSDIRPELRSPRQEESLRLLYPAITEIIHTNDPIRPIMRRVKEGMEALLGRHVSAFHRW